jgi:hypothetical protein
VKSGLAVICDLLDWQFFSWFWVCWFFCVHFLGSFSKLVGKLVIHLKNNLHYKIYHPHLKLYHPRAGRQTHRLSPQSGDIKLMILVCV